MSITRANFDDIAEPDLQALVDDGVPEGQAIDYKQGAYGGSDDDKKELLKDISSFANTNGGHLILGIPEEEGLPRSVEGLTGVDIDAEILRMENLARDAIEPRIVGIRFRGITLENGNTAIVARVPPSWNPPHRVKFKNQNRFFVRNSAGVHECSVEELRRLFTQSADFDQRVQEFRRQRVQLIVNATGAVPTVDNGGRLIIHILPFSAFREPNQVAPTDAYEQHMLFMPAGGSGFSPRYNLDGFAAVRNESDGLSHGYTQVFRNGAVEAVKSRFPAPHPENESECAIPSGRLEEFILLPVSRYLRALEMLRVPPPFVVMITITGTEGAFLAVGGFMSDTRDTRFREPEFLLPPIVIDDYSDQQGYYRAMQPIFDAIWNAAGLPRCSFFDADGNFVPPR